LPRIKPITTKSELPAEHHAVADALKNRYGVQWLVELTAVMGYFGMVSGIANAFEVAAPPDGDKLSG
jgi:hypothetical protein